MTAASIWSHHRVLTRPMTPTSNPLPPPPTSNPLPPSSTAEPVTTTLTAPHVSSTQSVDTPKRLRPARRPPLVPPLSFQLAATGVYRSGYPLEINFPMLSRLRLKTVMYACTVHPAVDLCSHYTNTAARPAISPLTYRRQSTLPSWRRTPSSCTTFPCSLFANPLSPTIP